MITHKDIPSLPYLVKVRFSTQDGTYADPYGDQIVILYDRLPNGSDNYYFIPINGWIAGETSTQRTAANIRLDEIAKVIGPYVPFGTPIPL